MINSANTEAVTGATTGYLLMAGLDYKNEYFTYKAYDYYAQDFINSLYIDASYKLNLETVKLNFAAQYINQTSIGNADTNLAKTGSLTGGKSIGVNSFGLKAVGKISSAKFVLAYSKVLSDDAKHDSLVLPWDGTPLFTNMITSNDLFQSIDLNLKRTYIYLKIR